MRDFLDSIAGHMVALSFFLLVGLGLVIWLEVFLHVGRDSLSLLAAKELEALSLGGLFYAMRISIKSPNGEDKKQN